MDVCAIDTVMRKNSDTCDVELDYAVVTRCG